MTQSSPRTSAIGDLGIVQQVLTLLADIRNLAQPLASAAGLQQALNSLVQLASLLGVNAAWIARVQSILADPTIFNVVLLIVQKVLGASSSVGSAEPTSSQAPTQAAAVVLDEQTLAQWLPFISEIISLIRQIRGAQ
jgi:hypothetical protein